MISMIAAVIALAAINIAYKAVGPAVLGDRELPVVARSVVDALPAAMLAGLLVVDLLGRYWQDVDGTDLVGLAVAVAARVSGRSHLVCIAIAVAVTAGLRALV
ncbi:MAG TPA: AzlD domain-containing protein [Catenuloplanes sp.]|jgi:branched-subunit amino acid transport protein